MESEATFQSHDGHDKLELLVLVHLSWVWLQPELDDQ